MAQEGVACLLTLPAGLSADTAMLHTMLGMPLTLVATEPAGGRARLKRGSNHFPVDLCLPGNNAPGGITQIGAVEIESDAAGEHLGILLTKTRISAGRTCLRAVETGTNARQQRVVRKSRLRMGLDHGVREAHWGSSKLHS